ncbi:MAG: glycosyl hydrolase family 95 catalytic domain-containing protein [Eubacteriales bacterium]
MKADRNTILIKRPASWPGDMWRTALPAGNGLTGAAMYGSVAEETILVNRHDLWCGSFIEGELPDLSGSLDEMRKKINSGDYMGANDIMFRALSASGYREGLAAPMPLGALKIRRQCTGAFTGYVRGIKLDRGEVFTRWFSDGIKCERRLFVSRAENIIYMKVRGGGESYTFAPQDNGDAASAAMLKIIKPTAESVLDENGFYIFFAASNEGCDYGAVVRFSGDINAAACGGRLEITGNDYTVMIKTFNSEKRGDAFERIKCELGEIKSESDIYREKMAENMIDYSPLYKAVSIKLASKKDHKAANEALLDEAYNGVAPPALLEKLWRFGRYLFISGTSEKGNPFPLYGLWHGTYNLMWSQHVANENVQMIYWHAAAGGLDYAVRALIKYYTAKTAGFEANARRLFGCEGIYAPAYTAPGSSGPSVPVPVILNWISCCGWLSAHFWEYYKYSGDREMLINEILPFMYKNALFYESYLTYDSDGSCVICPSVSPENTPANFMPDNFREDMGHICPCTKNAVMDFAVMRELLTNLIEASESVNIYVYTKKINTWKQILASIRPYTINSDGAVSEWMSPDLEDNYNHRHLSHIYPVFPGSEITPVSAPGLMPAFAAAVERRQLRGQSGWSFSHMACIWTRLGQGGRALAAIDLLAKGCLLDNFYTLHNDWRHMGVSLDINVAPVQLDALMGAVNAVQELAARYADGTLYILPAPDKRLRGISVRGLRFPGGMVSFKYSKDEKLSGSVSVTKDMSLRIFTPNNIFETELKAGGKYKFNS